MEAIPPPLEVVDQARLKSHVDTLTKGGPRHYSYPKVASAALDYLEKELSSYGYTVPA